MREGVSGAVRNSASSRFRRSATVTPGGRLKLGLLILLYAGLFLLPVGVVRRPSSTLSGVLSRCCRRLGALNMVCRLRRTRWDLDSDICLCMEGTCMFALAVVREVEGSSVSMAEMACPTAIF